MMTAITLSLLGVVSAPACPIDEAVKFVGSRYDENIRRSVRDIAANEKVRWIMPGSAITQDWVPSRLNMEVADDGLVTKAWCG